MKILVINGHPDKESYCQAIFQTIVENNIDSRHHDLKSSVLMKILILFYVMVIENVWKKIRYPPFSE